MTELYNSKKRKWKIVNRKNGFAKLNGFSAVGFDQNAYVFGGWDINELEVRNGLHRVIEHILYSISMLHIGSRR